MTVKWYKDTMKNPTYIFLQLNIIWFLFNFFVCSNYLVREKTQVIYISLSVKTVICHNQKFSYKVFLNNITNNKLKNDLQTVEEKTYQDSLIFRTIYEDLQIRTWSTKSLGANWAK